jgi:hypothetical protein
MRKGSKNNEPTAKRQKVSTIGATSFLTGLAIISIEEKARTVKTR